MRILTALATATVMATGAHADIFLPEGDAGSVLHLSDDLAEIGRIEGLENPHGLALAPSRGLLVVGSLAERESPEGSRMEMDMDSGMDISGDMDMTTDMEQPEGMSDAEHDAHHAGGEAKTGAVSIVTLVGAADHRVQAEIEVSGMVHHVEVDAAERFAVVTHPGLGGVSVIDLEDNSVRGPIATGPQPEYAVFDPDRDAFLVSNAGNATISVVDPERGIVLSNIPLDAGPKHLDRTAGGTVAAALADAGAVALLNGGAAERIEIGGRLHGVQVAEDAVWVAATERDVVVRIDRATGERLEMSPGAEPYHIALDGDALLVSSSAGADLWRLDRDTLETLSHVEAAGVVHQIRVADAG